MKKVTKLIEEEKPSTEAEIGKRIEYIRRKRGLSQTELGKALGVTKKTIIEYEDKNKIPLNKIKKIAVALDVTTDYLLGVSDIETIDKNMEIVHKTTGLSNNAIKVLVQLNEQDNILYSLDTTYKRYLDTISFLIEQEKRLPINVLSCSSASENALEEAEQQYNEQEEKLEQKYSYILSTIHNYFTVEIENEKIHIKDNSLKNILGKKYTDFLPETVVSNEDIVNREYLMKIQAKLKQAKLKYKKKKGM